MVIKQLFDPVKTYGEMLTKIAIGDFFTTLLTLYIIKHKVPQVAEFLHICNLPVKLEGIDFQIPLLYFLIPFVVALISRIIHLHDLISNLFSIRKKYDLDHILIPMYKAIFGNAPTSAIRSKLETNRHAAMRRIFYKYVSSTPEKCKIDPHYVFQALDALAWYWMAVEAVAIFIVGGVVALILGNLDAFFLTSIIFSVATMIVIDLLHRRAIRATRVEIAQILVDPAHRTEIIGEFNAL